MTVSEFVNKVGFKVKNEDVNKVNDTIGKIKDTASRALGFLGVGISLASINGLVEEFTRVNNQIKNATSSLGDQQAVQEQIMASAEATRTSYSETGKVVASLVKGNSELFGNVDEAVKFNNAATMLFKTAGKTNEDIAMLMEAINKSFQKGYIDSETISQLLEQAPEAVQLLNKQLGTTSDQLEDMATEGTFKVQDLKDAFVNSADEIEAEFDNVQYSITDALAVIRSKWGLWLAQTNETLGVTDGIGRTMVTAFNKVIAVLNTVRNGVAWLSDRLGGVQNMFKLVAIVAGSAFAVMNFSKITSGLSSILKVLSAINIKTIAIIAIVALIALVVEDFINFMQGNNSLIGTLLENAGIDSEAVRDTIINAWNTIKSFLSAAWYFLKTLCTNVWNGIKDFFVKHGDDIKAGLTTAWEFIKNTVITIWNGLSQAASDVVGVMKDVWDKHGEDVLNALSGAWETIQNILSTVWEGIKGLATDIFNGLLTFWQNHGEQIQTALSNAWTAIQNLLSFIWSLLLNIATTIFNALSAFWDTWGQTIITTFQGIWDTISSIFSTAFDVLADLFAVFSALFAGDWESLWTNVQQLGSDLWNGIVNIISTALNAIWSIFSSIWSVISEFVSTIWNNIASTISNIANQIWTTITSVWNQILTTISTVVNQIWTTITTVFTNIWNGIVETISGIYNSIVEGFTAAIDWIKSLPAQAVQWGIDIIQGIINGIKSAIGGVVDAVSGVANTIKSFLGFSEPEEGPLSNFHTYMPDMIDLMSKGITGGREKVRKALGGIANDMAMLVNAQAPSFGTASTAYGSNQISKSVIQNVNINNRFEGDKAIQQKAAGAMDKSARDVTAELARGLAYAK